MLTWSAPATVDSGFGGFSEPSLAFDPSTGEAAIAYSRTFEGPKFARQSSSGTWSTQLIESQTFSGDTVLDFSLVTLQPGVAFETALFGQPVRIAEWDGTQWSTVVATPGRNVGQQFGFGYAANGTPVLAFTPDDGGGTSMDVELMVHNGSDWVSWSTFQTNNWTFGMDLAILGNKPLVSYLTGHTYFAVPNAVVPEPSTLALLATAAASLLFMAWRRRRPNGYHFRPN